MKISTKSGKHRIFKDVYTVCCTMLLFILSTTAYAQNGPVKEKAVLDTCYASTEVYDTKVLPEAYTVMQQQLSPSAITANAAPPVKTADFEVTYVGFTPEAQAAFQYAVDIWSTIVSSPVPIKIYASFEELSPGVLGAAGPNYIWRDFDGVKKTNTYYVDALADALAGEDLLPGDENPDIVATFSSVFDWYYGTDQNPNPTEYDFVSVVLHEIGHGLGFIGGADYDPSSGVGYLRYGTAPIVYSDYVENGDGESILEYEDGTQALGDQLVSNDLYMNGRYAVSNLGGKKPKIYAPTSWSGGSSYSHWDEATFPAGDINSLMSPQLGYAESIHNIGPITRGLFRDLGWTLNHGKTTLISLRQTVQESNGADCGSLEVPTTDRITVVPNTEVCYYYTVHNEGDVTLNLHDLMDEVNGEILNDYELSLKAGESATVWTSGMVERESFANVATWTAYNPGPESEVSAVGVSNIDVFIPPVASVEPELLLETLPVDGMSKKKVKLVNKGEGELDYKIVIREFEAPLDELIKSSNKAVKEAVKSTELPKQSSMANIKVATAKNGGDLTKAITGGGENLKIVDYYTDFEDFELGELYGQDGWTNSLGYIISYDPFSDNQFLQSVTDGSGGTTLAFSPNVGVGSEPFSSFSATINVVGAGSTFEVIPQAPASESVVTRIQFATDGFIYLLIPGYGYVNTGIQTPSRTFDLQMVVDRTTFEYDFYIDGELIYTGIPAYAGDIEEIVLLSYNEADGPVMNFDNLVLMDGDLGAPDWVTVDPSAGSVDPKSTSPIDVFFDATGLDEGAYFASIYVLNNDPENSVISIPVGLAVGGEMADFNLIDSEDDVVLQPLADGDIINLKESMPPFNIEATMVSGASSVVFHLNGKKVRTENEAPYAVFGDINGDFDDWTPAPGKFELSAKFYSEPKGKGELLETKMISFEVIDADVEDLVLASVCTRNPDNLRKWKIKNPNDFDVQVSWLLVGTEQYGSFMAAPGKTFFTTETIEDENMMVIVWENEKGETQELSKVSDGIACSDRPSIIADIDTYPNPISERLNVKINGEVGDSFSLSILDQQSGKVFVNDNFVISEVGKPFELNTKQLPKGTHILMVKSGNAKETVRIVKE